MTDIVPLLRRRAGVIYITVEQSVADDVSQHFLDAATEIERLRAEVDSLKTTIKNMAGAGPDQ